MMQAEVDQDLVSYTRQALLDVVRARYHDSIHNGKIGSSVMAAKILLYSVDVAQDHIHRQLQDWQCIEASLTPNSRLIALLSAIDSFFRRFCGVQSGCVGYLDAFNERNALYVLINYIDAHEHALDQLHFIMGVEVSAEGVAAEATSIEHRKQHSRALNLNLNLDININPFSSNSSSAGSSRTTSRAISSDAQSQSRDLNVFSKLEEHQVMLEVITSVSAINNTFSTDLKHVTTALLKSFFSLAI